MTTTTLPAVGDTFEYDVIVSKREWGYGGMSAFSPAGHRATAAIPTETGHLRPTRQCDPKGKRVCPKCFDQWEKRTSTVASVTFYMDNSIEVVLEDGTRRNVVAPHGDACF